MDVSAVQPLRWEDGALLVLDQRLLPGEEVYLRLVEEDAVADAIRGMAVRGAPAIGVAAAFGIALGVHRSASEGEALRADFERIATLLRGTRPTAVNLFWAIGRMARRFEREQPRGGAALREALLDEA